MSEDSSIGISIGFVTFLSKLKDFLSHCEFKVMNVTIEEYNNFRYHCITDMQDHILSKYDKYYKYCTYYGYYSLGLIYNIDSKKWKIKHLSIPSQKISYRCLSCHNTYQYTKPQNHKCKKVLAIDYQSQLDNFI